VICGVDEPSTCAGAVGLARELAQRYELPLVYVHVSDGRRRRETVERALEQMTAGEDADIAIEHGHPADRLVAVAYARHASFVVVGNHGARSPLLGSVSADVSRRAPCPVIVVPPTADAAPERDTSAELLRGVW
jgi:nucleotide-binding universal stress UspA family protein